MPPNLCSWPAQSPPTATPKARFLPPETATAAARMGTEAHAAAVRVLPRTASLWCATAHDASARLPRWQHSVRSSAASVAPSSPLQHCDALLRDRQVGIASTLTLRCQRHTAD